MPSLLSFCLLTLALALQVCNRALRSMLREDLLQVRAVKEDLNVLGASFAAQHNLKAALFCYVLMQMTDHVVPKQAEGLQGSYKVGQARSLQIGVPEGAGRPHSRLTMLSYVGLGWFVFIQNGSGT